MHGGSILAGYETVLSFNGVRYPVDTSAPPAREATGIQGKVIISNTDEAAPVHD